MAAEPVVAHAHWGVIVVRMDGTVEVALNAGQFFQPASNAKLFTTAAAMALLPMDARVRTTVIPFGRFVTGGVLVGELQFVGAGDANFSGRLLPYVAPVQGAVEPPRDELRYIRELADKVKAAGVTAVQGDLVVDDQSVEPYPEGWEIDDAPWYYGAPVSALMIADNSVTVTVTPNSSTTAVGAPAAVTFWPDMPFYTVEGDIPTMKDRPASVNLEREMGSRVIHVSGSIRTTPYTQAMSIAEPALYAGEALKQALQQRGIAVSGTVRRSPAVATFHRPDYDEAAAKPVRSLQPLPALRTGFGDSAWQPCDVTAVGEAKGCILAAHDGPPLYEDVVVTNKTSQNLHAEAMLRLLTQVAGNSGFGADGADGASVVRAFLTQKAGVDGGDFVFVDGSGLSGHDLVTPRAAATLLRYAAGQPWGEKWKASLPVGGVDGSLQHRFTGDLKGRVFAKTGTLGEARALSGYVMGNSGKTVVFSVLVTGHTPLDRSDEAVMDRMVAAIAAAE